jgi:uncharacterized protein YgbK (DUF1537 family)
LSNVPAIWLAYYGDDFTGSTDALEFLCRAGLKTRLFLDPPTPEQLKLYPDLQAYGVAGLTRSMPPAAMQATLGPAFTQMKATGARHIHYKVCSTFDSSPTIGSIGCAIDTASAIFDQPSIPLLVAAPALGRYCVFGNLFARMGTGGKGEIYRLDRHPSMSKHPVTPAGESDLRLHLSKQTDRPVRLLSILQLEQSLAEKKAYVQQQPGSVVLIDALYASQLPGIGALLDELAQEGQLFSTGSSGIEMALGQHWQETGTLPETPSWVDPGAASPLLVLAGSCSPVTAAQIAHAKENGFALFHFNENMNDALEALTNGQSVIIHTGGHERGTTELIPAEQTGTSLGRIGRELAAQAPVHRVVVAGGDTSSYAARAMGIAAVEMIAPLVTGAPLCLATAPGSPLDGKEVNFKGGQVGDENYFIILEKGKI